jgi:hypothetical protein
VRGAGNALAVNGHRELAADELAGEQPAGAANQQDQNGGYHHREEDVGDPLQEADAEPRRRRGKAAVLDLAGDDGRHEKGERGQREHQVDQAAPDTEHRGHRADRDEQAKHEPWLAAREQREDDTEQGRGDKHEHGVSGGHRAEPAQQRA